MSTPVLQLTNLDVRFPGLYKTVHAVRGVSLSVNEGEIVALVGESGSGKTMTAMAALGLLPPNASIQGQCSWLGHSKDCADLQKQPPRTGAIVFQNPLTALNPYFTIGQQLNDVAIARTSKRRAELDETLVAVLQDVQLPDPEGTLAKYPHQLSGGQIQRVVIAMALLCEPDILIADEPTTALDVTVQAQILILLRELAESKGMAVLLITHDLGVVGTLSDRVEVMYAGRIVESGPVEPVLNSPQHPYTQQLIATIPDIDHPEIELQFIEGQVPDLSKPIQGCAFYERCNHASDVCLSDVPDRPLSHQHIVCHQPWLTESKTWQEGA